MEKCRVFVLTDIGEWKNEPDDAQSLIRLMLYSNEIDIEGIIPTASHCAPDISDPSYLDRCNKAVQAYKEAYPNLIKHAEGYPDPDLLFTKVKQGTPKVYLYNYDLHLSDEEKVFSKEHPFKAMMTLRRPRILSGDYELTTPNIGEGLSNDGSNLIVEALEKEDTRPVWFCLWGGSGTLAQALYDIRGKYTYEKVKAISEKIRVYDIDGQDDCGAWICKYFPEVKWLRSDTQFWGMSQGLARFGDNIADVMDESRRAYWYDNGDISCVSDGWVAKNVQSHGPLGAAYPPTKFGMETDSPSMLHTIRNGLNDPEHWEWGGWGGRYTAERSKNPPAVHFHGDYLIEPKPFFAYSETIDTWTDPISGRTLYNDPFAPVGRWRADFQNEMAVRMDWSVTQNYADANHNPIAIVNGDTTRDILHMSAQASDTVTLNASASYDPDGDELRFKWYVYKDAGTYRKNIEIDGSDQPVATISIPADATNEDIHVILEVEDNGKGFPLKAYRRVIVRTGEGGYAKTAPMAINDADVNPGAYAHFEYIGSWEHAVDQFGCNDCDLHVSAVKDDKAVLYFTGRQVKLFGAALTNSGFAAFSIDDGPEELVDCYSQILPWKNMHDIHVYATTGGTLHFCSKLLPRGEHKLTVRVTGEKNENATDCRVAIDKAEIFA